MQGDNEIQTPRDPNKNGSGWLREPAQDSDLLAQIGEESRMTPGVLASLEEALAAGQRSIRRKPRSQANCPPLEECGTFKGSGPGSCPGLKKCGQYD
jgi:hypothetical protein